MLKRKHDKIINIMQLRFFCQVALRGSVSRAADDLFRTQSAITRAIRDLEAALNVTLFERHYSGMVPTEYGKCILPRARRAIDDLQAIPALLQKHHTRSSGPLADAGWLFNTRRLAIFIQLYHVNHTQTVAQQLGITQPAVSAALKVLEKGADSALFRRTPEGVRPTPAAELLYPPVSRALNELENIWSDLAARRGVLEGTVRIGALPLPQPTVETGDAAMVRGLLQGSDMLAAVSASQMRFETDNGLLSVLPVPLPDTTRRIGLTFRAGSLPSPATQALLRFIYQQVQDGAV